MFNHQARWDRNLPQTDTQPSGADIIVQCLFDKNRLIPQSFSWRNRDFLIKKINFSWKNKQGRDTLYFFSVSTSSGAYEIVFSQETLSWRLNKLIGP
jgi:hypothetical protein